MNEKTADNAIGNVTGSNSVFVGLGIPWIIGPSGVRALPLAAGINEGGHYFGPSGAVQTVSDSRRPLLVRAALCRRCLTAVGHYFGPSGAVQTFSVDAP